MIGMAPTTMTIRSEQPEDAAAIADVHRSAFPTPLEAQLVALLRDAGRLTVSLVALVDERIVGHIALSPVTIGNATGCLGLAPMAVLPPWQGQGIGSALVRAGLQLCREASIGSVVVLGEPGYYRRFGFEPAARWKLSDAYGGGEAFQAIELRSGAIPAGGGPVAYAEEFAIFETGEAD